MIINAILAVLNLIAGAWSISYGEYGLATVQLGIFFGLTVACATDKIIAKLTPPL